MIVSMTGFGDASGERDGVHYAIEIRSLNNRFFKAVIKLPEALAGLEPELESSLRKRLGRGSITYVLKMRMDSADAAYHINMPALNAYLAQLRQLVQDEVQIDLSTLLTLPGICQEPRDDTDEIAAHGQTVRELTDQAVARLQQMRQREGAALCDELMRHAAVIREHLDAIETRAPHVLADYHKRLSARVNELLSSAQLKVSEQDLLREVAVFAERSDIAEEVQRLRSHLDAFSQACREDEHSGRKLDFITQEMLREANTISSKGNDAEIARHIVEVKGAIDRLKEQVQNVE